MQPVAKMWKPTKPGVYALGDDAVIVDVDAIGPYAVPSPYTPPGVDRGRVSDHQWALLSADWQDGPPTTKQLERWRSWAISDDTRTMAGWVISASPVGYNINGHYMLSVDGVRKSAPVQPVSGEVLWVPLEVTK